MFWLLAVVLVVLALGFAAWPLWRGTSRVDPASGDRRRVMRALYRDRVAELEAEALSGQLDVATRDQVVAELGANLLEEIQSVAGHSAAEPSPGPGSRRVAWMLAVSLPLCGIAVYLSVGEPSAIGIAGAAEVLNLDPEADRARIEDWQKRLQRRVDQRGGDAQSWYLLGVSRLQLGAFEEAAGAFERTHELVGDDPNVDLYWLQARYLADGGALSESGRALAARLLDSQPGHPMVQEMLAVDAYRRGEFRAAVEHLNLALNNPLSPQRQAALLGGLAQARSRMGELTPSVEVAVALPDAAPRDATLFVIARPPGGGMPYAVVRRPAGLLPLSVHLDDTVSMSRGRSLSGAERIEVVVRLSRSGSPQAAPGDWEWRSRVLELADLSGPLKLDAVLAPWNHPSAAVMDTPAT